MNGFDSGLRRCGRVGFALSLLATGSPQHADAQRTELGAAAAVARPLVSAMQPAALTRTARSDTTSRASRVAQDALVGAAVGAGTGLFVGAILASRPGVTDHSEDGLAFLALATFGALVGLVVGTILGLIFEP